MYFACIGLNLLISRIWVSDGQSIRPSLLPKRNDVISRRHIDIATKYCLLSYHILTQIRWKVGDREEPSSISMNT